MVVLATALLIGAVSMFGQAPGGQAPGGAPDAGGRGAAGAGDARGGAQAGGMGMMGRRGAVEVTDEEKAAAQDMAKKILALNISATINAAVQSTADGTVAETTGRGGMGGFGGGQPGGMGGGARGQQEQVETGPPYPATPASKQVVDALVATVQSSSASRMEKSNALRQLAVVGTADTIPVIASLLGDAELSHMARYALEPNPDPSVDVVFRNALNTVKGLQLAGVIYSVGARRDAQAVNALTGFLQNSDADIAHAAAIALGKIGNAAAAKALQSAAASAPAANIAALSEGLFRCAESLSSQGQDATATAIYDQVLKMSGVTNSIRTAALRGAILSRKANGLSLLQQYLQGSDYTLFVAAVRTSHEMTLPGVTKALTDALAKQTSDDNKILVIDALGKRGDAAAVATLIPLAQKGSKDVRVAAIKAMVQAPAGTAVPVLENLMADADTDVSAAAKSAIGAIEVKAADDAAVAKLKSSSASDRLAAIEMISGRSIKSSIPDLIKLAGSDSDAKVRQAALKTAGTIGGSENLPALLELSLNLKSADDMDAAVESISSILSNVSDKSSFTQDLMKRLASAQPAQKSSLLRLLSIAGGTQALNAVQSAVSDSNAQVHSAALQSLSEWPDFEAAKPLVDLAANSSTSLTDSVLALRGAVRLIRDNYSTQLDDCVNLSLSAYDAARRDTERREVISVMGNLRNIKVGNKLVDIATNNQALRNEAGTAAAQVATALYTGQTAGGRGGMGMGLGAGGGAARGGR